MFPSILAAVLVVSQYPGYARGAPCATTAVRQTYQAATTYAATPALIVAVPVASLNVKYNYAIGYVPPPQATMPAMPVPQAPAVKAMPPVMPAITAQSAVSSASLFGGDLVAAAPVQTAAAPVAAGLSQRVATIMANRCVSCHAPGAVKSNIQLVGTAGDLYVSSDRFSEIERRAKIYDAVARHPGVSPMPKNANPLPAEEVETFLRWLTSYVSTGVDS